MMKKTALLIACLAVLLCAACSNDPEGMKNRPGGTGSGAGEESEAEKEPDYTEVLSNGNIRYEAHGILLDYEDGGILYTHKGNDHRLVNLTTGLSVRFNPLTPALSIDGADEGIESCRLIDRRDGLCWYVLQPGERYVVVEE